MVCGALRFTYREFSERSNRLSHALRELGVVAGDRVAFLSFNCHRLLEAYYGVPQASAVLLPLNIRLSAEELAYILKDASPRVLFFDLDHSALVESLLQHDVRCAELVCLDGAPPTWARSECYEELLSAADTSEIEYQSIEENAVAELFYTSGTTAHPKGVMLTHRNLYLHAFSVAAALRPADADVGLYTVPLFHVNSWGMPHVLTLAGGRHVILKKFDAGETLRLIEQERVTRLQMVPAMLIALLNHPHCQRADLSSVKEVMMGGAPASEALVRQAQKRFAGSVVVGGYGLTETSPVATIAYPKDHLQNTPEEVRLRRAASAGFPIAGVEVRVVDLIGKDVPADGNTVGEILVRGDGAMAGYWNQPEETARVLRDGWLATGDLATVDEEGYILIVDRAKDMILSGGENIATAQVERAIYDHPAVLECAVIAVPDDRWGEVPKAFVVLKPGDQVSEGEILAHCREHLAGYEVPKSVEFRDALPKGGTGKILKRVLREPYWQGRERRVH